MQTSTIPTEFAPAERVPIDVIQRQSAALAASPLTLDLLDAVLDAVLILNEQRQIIYASHNVLPLAGASEINQLLGKRPGEVLGCQHSHESVGGCGTTLFCSECGAAKAILASLKGHRDLQECHMTRVIGCGGSDALDLLVCATPFRHDSETFCIFAVADISHEKRRRALERVFFHDVMNSAWGLSSLATMVNDTAPDDLKDEMSLLDSGLHDLLEEIQMQKDLTAAETNELAVKPVAIHSAELLGEVVKFYQNHQLAKDRQVRLAPDTATAVFESDRILLKRILGNLIKNAVEAIKPGQTVTAGCRADARQVRFWIHNPTVMSREVQLQVFNRSFSTKGLGRGLGTYSVRLLTEKYLQGTVGFESTAVQGTTFFVDLPQSAD